MSRESGKPTRLQALLAENTALRAKLEEAEETLRAIREGEVDAIVVSGTQGEQVFSLTGSESVYRLIVETMKEAALTVTTEGRILFCNGQFSAFVQTPPEKILGRPLTEFVAADDRGLVAALLTRSQEASIKQRLVFQGSEGPPVPAHVSATALCQADSLSLCLVATDLTELEASTELLRLLRTEQAALRASEEEFRAFFDNAAVGAVELGLDGRFLQVNDRYCALTGFAREELLGMTPADLALPEERAADQAQLAAYLREPNTVFDVEKRYVRKDSRILWVRVSAAPIRDAAGRPLRSAGIVQDITVRKQTEAALRLSEAKFATAFTANPAAIALTRLVDGRFLDVNDTYLGITGFRRDEVIGRTAGDLGAWPNAGARARFVDTLRRHGAIRGWEARFRKKSGEEFDALLSAEVITVGGEEMVLSTYLDITERKRAEAALNSLNATLEQRVSDRTAELAEAVEALEGEVAQRKQAEAHLQETNRALRILSDCNQALVRFEDERLLTQEICRIAVEVGGYRMAWVGLAEHDADQSVRPVAAVGFEAGYLESARITWADTARGRGPTGAAIRLGEVQIGTDFFTEPRLAPWRAEAIQRGFRSSIALPLRQAEGVLGALTIYAAEPAAFPEAQVKVLLELAEDLAFGIHAVRMRAALRASRDRLRALAIELTLAEQRERRRLADVLHDGLQQLLVAARLRAHMLCRADDPEVRRGAEEIVGLLAEGLTDSRTLMRELSPPTLQKGELLPALEWLIGWMAEKHHLTVGLARPAVPLPTLSEDLAVLLYQAVRELLLNAVKHAHVQAAELTVVQEGPTLTLTVADAGTGFDPLCLRVAGGTEGGFGLLGIRERLELVGGRLEIESAPGRGSRLTLTVPIPLAA